MSCVPLWHQNVLKVQRAQVGQADWLCSNDLAEKEKFWEAPRPGWNSSISLRRHIHTGKCCSRLFLSCNANGVYRLLSQDWLRWLSKHESFSSPRGGKHPAYGQSGSSEVNMHCTVYHCCLLPNTHCTWVEWETGSICSIFSIARLGLEPTFFGIKDKHLIHCARESFCVKWYRDEALKGYFSTFWPSG